jgi:hypothetical protein
LGWAQVNTRIYNVLQRYETLSRCASPLNCTLDSYNSLFPDVDGVFGSLGSFFDFIPQHGAFEANPPFDTDSVIATFQHIQRVLQLAQESQERHRRIGSTEVADDGLPLLFVVVTPFVPDAVVSDEFLIWQEKLAAHEHSYTLGMKHRGGSKGAELWECTGVTVLSFIGNRAAKVKWPVTAAKVKKLRAAFR